MLEGIGRGSQACRNTLEIEEIAPDGGTLLLENFSQLADHFGPP